MIVNSQIPLHRLILSLSDALDFVHPMVADHQQRVAYIAINMARHMGRPKAGLDTLFIAATLHDIGLMRTEDKLRVYQVGELERMRWHAAAGYHFLSSSVLFAEAARIVLHHHISYSDPEPACGPVPFDSYILAVADEVERSIDRHVSILEQREEIVARIVACRGKTLHPDCVDAFRAAARTEAFWLDLVSERIYGLLLAQVDWPMLHLEGEAITQIAQIFSRVVDASSPWTATHSAGVTATAVELAARMSFSPREQMGMRVAGYLHDLGKLSVPAAILDKPGKLTAQERAVIQGHPYHTYHILDTIGGFQQITEWAAFHHERLDGNGYPFHHAAKDLTLGSRIMAVADTFTAIAEDRPYRGGMSKDQILRILDEQVANRAFDGDVVGVLKRDYEAILALCQVEQSAYAHTQQQVPSLMHSRELAKAA